MCNFWIFCHWPNFIPKYGTFENGPVSQKPLHIEQKVSLISTPWDRKKVYVQLLEILPMAKFHAQIWQLRKLARMSMNPTFILMHWSFSVRGYFGVIWCTCLKIASSSNTDVRREKRNEIWKSGVAGIMYMYMGYLWLFSVQGHLRVLIMQWNIWI